MDKLKKVHNVFQEMIQSGCIVGPCIVKAVSFDLLCLSFEFCWQQVGGVVPTITRMMPSAFAMIVGVAHWSSRSVGFSCLMMPFAIDILLCSLLLE
jgi:hypothetical protein